MATETEKFIIRNIAQADLINSILERIDLPEIIQKFRTNDEFKARDYMTVKEFSKYLNCSEAYVRSLIQYGRKNNSFYVAKVGREYRIDRISYDNWVAAGGEF